jgi:hypothetical protein
MGVIKIKVGAHSHHKKRLWGAGKAIRRTIVSDLRWFCWSLTCRMILMNIFSLGGAISNRNHRWSILGQYPTNDRKVN